MKEKRPLGKKWAWILMGCSMAMMVYGHFRGEIQVVLNKAIRICLECIGVG